MLWLSSVMSGQFLIQRANEQSDPNLYRIAPNFAFTTSKTTRCQIKQKRTYLPEFIVQIAD
jgi:hypothetical protein